MAGHPIRDRGAAGGGHLLQLGEIGDREDAWHDRYPDAGGVRAIAEAKEQIDIEEELSDRAAGASVELALQVVEVVLGALRFRVGLGIGGDADLEIGDALQSPDEIGGISVAAGIWRVMLDAAGRITAQRNDVADPGMPVTMRHRIDFGSGGGNAGEMGRRFERGLVADAPDRRVRALTGRAARPIGHRHKTRGQRFEAPHHLPQPLLHFSCLRRKEFEGDAWRAGVEIAARVGGEQAARSAIGSPLAEVLGHQWSSLSSTASGTVSRKSLTNSGGAEVGRAAVQMTTVNGSPASRRGGAESRPAASHHSTTSTSAKPRRRWACSSRRNSSECGAKSTSTRNPFGRNTRAASAMTSAGRSA